MTSKDYFHQLTRLQKVIPFLPFIGGALRSYTGIPSPPFGDSELVWRFATAAIVLCAALAPMMMPQAGRRLWPICCTAVLFFISAGSYIVANQTFVRGVQLPNEKWKFVVIGGVRQPSLDQVKRSESDYDLIKDVGFTDSELERAYTEGSLKTSRWILFLTYMPSLAVLEFGLGLWVLRSEYLQHALPPNPSDSASAA